MRNGLVLIVKALFFVALSTGRLCAGAETAQRTPTPPDPGQLSAYLAGNLGPRLFPESELDENYDRQVDILDGFWVCAGWVVKSPARNFDYPADAPPGYEVGTVSWRENVQVQEIAYSGESGAVSAYLVLPPGPGPFAGVIYLHWGQGDKEEFLNEAVTMANRGAVSLLLDAPWLRPVQGPWAGDGEAIRIVVDIRRGVDLLTALPQVDPSRLGYVGHSYGASRGGILTAVERRLKAFVLMAGYARPSAYEPSGGYTPLVDGIYYVGSSSPASLLFQFAEHDAYITRGMAAEYYGAAGEPKAIRWYNATHSLNAAAREDRLAWLGEVLGLP